MSTDSMARAARPPDSPSPAPLSTSHGTAHEGARLTGLFRTRNGAEHAYQSVSNRGYGKEDVDLVMSADTRDRLFAADRPISPESRPEPSVEPAAGVGAGEGARPELPRKAVEGAGIGGAIGGSLGAIAAAVAAIGTTVALPGLGLVIAGPLAAAIAGASAGAATGGIVGALIGWGLPESQAQTCGQGVEDGGVLMAVQPRTEDDAAYLEAAWKRHSGEVMGPPR
ncbi:hypothetical protein BH11PSE9_BH11PSE9_09230 [soil metagenome]